MTNTTKTVEHSSVLKTTRLGGKGRKGNGSRLANLKAICDDISMPMKAICDDILSPNLLLLSRNLNSNIMHA